MRSRSNGARRVGLPVVYSVGYLDADGLDAAMADAGTDALTTVDPAEAPAIDGPGVTEAAGADVSLPQHGDQQGGRSGAVAPTGGDSTSYDTDADTQASGHKAWGGGISLFKKHPHSHHVAFSIRDTPGVWGRFKARCAALFLPPPPPVAAVVAPDGVAAMYAPPTAADVVRHLKAQAAVGLERLRAASFDPPDESRAVEQGVLYSLVSRQVPVQLPQWESYAQELLERETESRGKPRCSVFGLPLLHPACGAALAWFAAMLLFDVAFTAFWTPINTAFCLEQYGRLEASCTRTDLAGGIIYIANILVSFQVGVTLCCGYRSRAVADGRDTASLYARTWTFWLDVLAVVPFVYLLVLIGLGDSAPRNQTVSIVSLMRLVRLFRVAGIIKTLYTNSVGGELQPSWLADNLSITTVYMALLTYLAAVVVNLYACVLLLIAYYEQRGARPSWMGSIAWMDVATAPGARRWFSAVYFVITVMTTTGYADFLPKSPIEQVVINIVALNGLLVFGALVALIGDALKRSQAHAQAVFDSRKKLTYIRHWMRDGGVEDKVQRDVMTFFSELGAKKEDGRTEGDIVFELPAHLRQKVVRHVLLGLLAQCPQLKDLDPEVRELMASHCVPLELPTGHELFRLGDDTGGPGLWLLEEGVVFASRGQERLEAPAGATGSCAPCLLGDAALLAELVPECGSRMWTLRTERPCRVWQLRGPALRAVQRLYPRVGRHMAAFVQERLKAWMVGTGAEVESDGWCEVVQLLKRSFIGGPLRDRINDCYMALNLASVEDGSLLRLLSAWLDMSVSREMTLADGMMEDRASAFSVDGPRSRQARESRMVAAQLAAAAMAGGSNGGGLGGSGRDLLTPAGTPEGPLSLLQLPPFGSGLGDPSADPYGLSGYGMSGYGTSGYGGVAGDGASGYGSIAGDGGADGGLEGGGGGGGGGGMGALVAADTAGGGGGGVERASPLSRRLLPQRSLRGVAGAPLMVGRLVGTADPSSAIAAATAAGNAAAIAAAAVSAAAGDGVTAAGMLTAAASVPAPMGPPPLLRRTVASARWASRDNVLPVPLPPPVPTPVEQALQQLRHRPRSSRFLSESGALPHSFKRAAAASAAASALGSVDPSTSGHSRRNAYAPGGSLRGGTGAAAALYGPGGSLRDGTGAAAALQGPGGSWRGGTGAAAALAAVASPGGGGGSVRRAATTSAIPSERTSAPSGPVAAAVLAKAWAAAASIAAAAEAAAPLTVLNSTSTTAPGTEVAAAASMALGGSAGGGGGSSIDPLLQEVALDLAGDGGDGGDHGSGYSRALTSLLHREGSTGLLALRGTGSSLGEGGRVGDGDGLEPLTPPPSPPQDADFEDEQALRGLGLGAVGPVRRRSLSESGVAAGAALPLQRRSRVPRLGTDDGAREASGVPPPPAPPPRPQPPPGAQAAALTRSISGSRTSFINKIFLAAGVPMPPQPSLPTAAAAGGGDGGAVATGVVIAGPACTACGCATCAFCARVIVPPAALSFMVPVEPPAVGSNGGPQPPSQLLPRWPSESAGGGWPSAPRGGGGGSLASPLPGAALGAALHGSDSGRGFAAGSGSGAAAAVAGSSVASFPAASNGVNAGLQFGGGSGGSASGYGASGPMIRLLGDRPLPPGVVRSGSSGLATALASSGASGAMGPRQRQGPPLPRARSMQPRRGGDGSGGGGSMGMGMGVGQLPLPPVPLGPSGSYRMMGRGGGGDGGGGGGLPYMSPGAALTAAAVAVSDQQRRSAGGDGEGGDGGAARGGEAAESGAFPPRGALLPSGSMRLSGTMDII